MLRARRSSSALRRRSARCRQASAFGPGSRMTPAFCGSSVLTESAGLDPGDAGGAWAAGAESGRVGSRRSPGSCDGAGTEAPLRARRSASAISPMNPLRYRR